MTKKSDRTVLNNFITRLTERYVFYENCGFDDSKSKQAARLSLALQSILREVGYIGVYIEDYDTTYDNFIKITLEEKNEFKK